jgi:hypothetical protein
MERYYEMTDASAWETIREIGPEEFEAVTAGAPPQVNVTIGEPLRSGPQGDINRAFALESKNALAPTLGKGMVVWRYSEESGIAEGWVIPEPTA